MHIMHVIVSVLRMFSPLYIVHVIFNPLPKQNLIFNIRRVYNGLLKLHDSKKEQSAISEKKTKREVCKLVSHIALGNEIIMQRKDKSCLYHSVIHDSPLYSPN